MKIQFAAIALLLTLPAQAHTRWKNGDPVPKWVTQQCCGARDIHELDPSQVHDDGQTYTFTDDAGKPIDCHIPHSKALPSQDSAIWLFYDHGDAHTDYAPGTGPYQAQAYTVCFCFFLPMTY